MSPRYLDLSALARCCQHAHGWLLVATALLSPLTVPAQPRTAEEIRLKAGYLVKFTQYVTWPSNALKSASGPVLVGVRGSDTLFKAVEKEAKGFAGARRVQARLIATPEEAAQCQVVFLSREEDDNEQGWLQSLRDRPILTVVESSETLAAGAVVSLNLADRRVVFEVSWPAMERARLKISPEMLRYAKAVHNRTRLPQ